MNKPYFLEIKAVYDSDKQYEEQTEPKIFTPTDRYFYAYKHPGETITIEIAVEDIDRYNYCASSSGDVDIYCGESHGRS